MRGVCAGFALAVLFGLGGAASADSTRQVVGPRTIVFLQVGRGGMLVESDGSRLRRAPFPGYPVYSPDRRHAFFTKRLRGLVQNFQIVVANSNGSGRHVVATERDGCLSEAAWSPNGETIAYASMHGCDGVDFTSIWIVDRDGTNRKRLTGYWNWRPVWSPRTRSGRPTERRSRSRATGTATARST